jgi:phospholipid/cholesterol/gamma-HCH transport system substrate-binding protein
MLIVWFGESPGLLRDQLYLKARYADAPGVLEGVAVRKSGIRVGEVSALEFDHRPNQPDGVLVTMAIERKYSIREGSVPRLSRSLIGDVTIDMLPGDGKADLPLGNTPATAPIIDGQVAPDPSKALASATQAFDMVGDTLKTINAAAEGLSKLSKNAEHIDEFIKTWVKTGQDLSAASEGIDRFLKANETDLRATIANLQKVSDKLNSTLSPETQDALKTGIAKISSAATRLDAELAELAPLVKDLGAPVNQTPSTDFGQTVRRVNRVAADIELLSATLRSRNGTLNTNGSIQKLLTQSELHDNFNTVALNASRAMTELKAVLTSFRAFADRVSRDPSAISRGVLSR